MTAESVASVQAPRRAWTWKPVGLALAYLYLPQLAPLFGGPLTECSHCVGTFFSFFPCMPGMLIGALLARDAGSAAGIAVAAGTTLALAAILLGVLQTQNRPRFAIAWFVAILASANSLAFAEALRA